MAPNTMWPASLRQSEARSPLPASHRGGAAVGDRFRRRLHRRDQGYHTHDHEQPAHHEPNGAEHP
ncbi:MAG: hypothetical protein LC792_09270 [Actinobacteria bacterium]|nr:hypothetical protein [Actinomycetota bacterium]